MDGVAAGNESIDTAIASNNRGTQPYVMGWQYLTLSTSMSDGDRSRELSSQRRLGGCALECRIPITNLLPAHIARRAQRSGSLHVGKEGVKHAAVSAVVASHHAPTCNNCAVSLSVLRPQSNLNRTRVKCSVSPYFVALINSALALNIGWPHDAGRVLPKGIPLRLGAGG
jgi:hypothetical protein